MKIAGLTYLDNKVQMYLKPDSALLVNKKPFFLPHFSEKIDARPCIVAKIGRMGRFIAPKFASRYYQQTAPGLCFMSRDLIATALLDDFTRGIAFDNSMAVGMFRETTDYDITWFAADNMIADCRPIEDLNNAVAMVSRYITLRTGDMIAVEYSCSPIALEREMIITATKNNDELLYCKIK